MRDPKTWTFVDLAKTVGQHHGPMPAIVVMAALEVAMKRWTAEDTKEYGTTIRERLEAYGEPE